jgi:hypothetical protein
MKYLMYVEMKTGPDAIAKWVELEAKGTLLDTMRAANRRLEEMPDVHMALILEKTGKSISENVTYTDFEEILITRDGRSWQAHDLAEHAWQITWAQDKRSGKSWAAAV